MSCTCARSILSDEGPRSERSKEKEDGSKYSQPAKHAIRGHQSQIKHVIFQILLWCLVQSEFAKLSCNRPILELRFVVGLLYRQDAVIS